ncbi:hypothetical protein DL95DRAFT_454213 [Leptodontidium sp. 2 PMI_412]|nr:hypothetical protein DL95DRAFT_454213 [Leptodontidium sp. 2 PMI_412]
MATNLAPVIDSTPTEDVEAQGLQEQNKLSTGSIKLGEGPTATANSTSDDPEIKQTEAENRTFTLFPKLPIELRFKIWKDAQPCGRVVDIIFKQSAPDDSFTMAAQPVLLSVNQESRSETLKIFKLITPGLYQDAPSPRPPIYIDPLNDYLLIADDWKTAPNDPDTIISLERVVSWLSVDVVKSLKRLAIGVVIMETNMAAGLPYGLRMPTPPLLAPHEEARFPVYLPSDVQFAKSVAAGGDALFAELDEILHLPPRVDGGEEIEDLMEDIQDELDAVSLEHKKWKMPDLGIAAAE